MNKRLSGSKTKGINPNGFFLTVSIDIITAFLQLYSLSLNVPRFTVLISLAFQPLWCLLVTACRACYMQ